MAGHVSDPAVVARTPGSGRDRHGRGAAQLKLARFGDNMRDVAVTEGDKVEAQLRFGVSVNTYGVNDLVVRVDGHRCMLIEQYADKQTVPSWRPAVINMSRCAMGRGSRRDCAPFSTTASVRSPPTQDLGGFASFPAGGAAADGRGLRLRRRGRLEDLGDTAHDQGHGR